jgi:hypothetical protein
MREEQRFHGFVDGAQTDGSSQTWGQEVTKLSPGPRRHEARRLAAILYTWQLSLFVSMIASS